MKLTNYILLAGLLCCPLLGQTAKTRAGLYTEVDASLASGTQITAATLRTMFKDTIASAQNGLTDGTALTTSAIGATVQAYSAALDTFASNGSAYYLSRTNHTGSQAIATITGLQAALDAKAPATSGTSILYGNGSGGFSSVTVGSGLTFSSGTLSASGGGDVSAASSFGTDNRLIRSDGTGKGVQASGIAVDDSNNVSGVGNLSSISGNNGTTSNAEWRAPDSLNGYIPSFFLGAGTYGLSAWNGGFIVTNGSNIPLQFGNGGAQVAANALLGFTTDNNNANAGLDTAFSRISAGLVGIGTGAAGSFAGSLKLTDITVQGNISLAGNTLVNSNGGGGSFRIINNGALQTAHLWADTDNTLTLRNGVNAQAFDLYSTYTDTNNYERLTSDYNSGVGAFRIYPKADGTGTVRALALGGVNTNAGAITIAASGQIMFTRTGVANRWSIEDSGHFIAQTDNTYDIGASGATRPRNIYAAGLVESNYLRSDGNVDVGSNLRFTGSGYIIPSSDGVWALTNAATTGFDRLQFGGTTSSFPALRRTGAQLDVVLADGSNYASLRTGALQVDGLLQTRASIVGGASINIPHGTAPTSPTNGDLWTTTGGIFGRVNGSTLGLLGTGTLNFGAGGTLGTAAYTSSGAYQPIDAALTALAGGSDFVAFSGPTTSTKTFTLPDATATILTTNAAVTVAQGGTGAATLTGILKGNGTSAFTAATLGTDYLDSTYISDTAFAPSWNGVTTIAPSKNAVYDWAHAHDTDDDGLPDKLDLGTAGLVRTTSGGVISSAEFSGDVTTSGSNVAVVANIPNTATFAAPSLSSQPNNNGGWVVYRVASSDATTTGQSLTPITGLVTGTLDNSTLYEIEAVLFVTTSTGTNGTEYGITAGGSGGAAVPNIIVTGTTTTNATSAVTISTIDTATAAYLTTASINGVITMKGWVTTRSAGTATLSLEHLKVTSGTSTVKIGSIFRVRKA